MMMMSMANRTKMMIFLWICLQSWTANAWMLPMNSSPSTPFLGSRAVSTSTSTGSSLSMAAGGFGGSGKKKDNKKPKKKSAAMSKLKPKQQWDRYLDLKKETRFRVAVKVGDEEDEEWLEVGNVRSQENQYTKLAVARQRALIAEHARRLFPLQVSSKDRVAWAYWDQDTDEWIVVDKAVMDQDDVPAGLEKMIGFEGRPDPSTGFYCVYNEGRLVKDTDDMRPSSKKLE